MILRIAGAGLAGLLAANMLARLRPTIFEMQPTLPNNHSAVLRFRSSIVGDTLNIPFERVNMIKAPLPWKNPVADALQYSFKCTGAYRSDRSIVAGLVSEPRWIAPSDLIARMAEDLSIVYGKSAFSDFDFSCPTISTIPMPKLMKLLNFSCDEEFRYCEGVNIRAQLKNVSAYTSLLIPHPNITAARVSITGDELIIEIPNCSLEQINPIAVFSEVVPFLGLAQGISATDIVAHSAPYAKIIPIDETLRKDFIHWATKNFNIYSLGRFATWRPHVLMDDLVQDIRIIERLLTSNYASSLQHVKGTAR